MTTATSTALALDTSVSVTNLNSVSYGALVIVPYDSIYATYPDAITEVYAYKLSGSTVATVTIAYTDSTKALLDNVVRS